MEYIELNREFVPLLKNKEPSADMGRLWGRRYGGGIGWEELREYRRVILLAEASSGKSEEFRAQTDILEKEGKAAFFVRIEELADQGFEESLDPGAAEHFQLWQKGATEGWFFLDAVDEARLNHKSFETALKRFARALNQALDRATVIISCRITDWKGEKDRIAVARYLPAHQPPIAVVEDADNNPLLDPLFKKNPPASRREKPEPERKLFELQIVQLAPLSEEQYRILASAAGIVSVDDFVVGIKQQGLDAYTERPGDVLDLIDYWKEYGKFGSLESMTEYAIILKLRERDPYRADNATLSDIKAREGAERIAGALTLGKSFTLRVPDHDPDPSLSSGAIDLATVLPEWSDAERNAIARRAVFAPATYGRIRFHHRSTQEYLTATWLKSLLTEGCTRTEVWDLIFAERYGVKTVVPSLRPVAAWLGLWYEDFCQELILREPIVLLRGGDPGSLPIAVRERLLLAFARKQAAGEIADDNLDYRSLWMFADLQLEAAIRECWKINSLNEFHLTLLCLVREGKIFNCVDLARGVALDTSARDYSRIVAIEILQQCNDANGLAAAAQLLLANASTMRPSVSAAFAEMLYPANLNIDELLKVIANTESDKKYGEGEFGHRLKSFYEACPTVADQRVFVAGLADLCLQPPFVESYSRISRRYAVLARSLEPVVRAEIQKLGTGEPAAGMIRLLMVYERADERYDLSSEDSLREFVQANSKLNRALMWADAAEKQIQNATEEGPTRFWQIHVHGLQLWRLASRDISWLEGDLDNRPDLSERRIALSAIVSLLFDTGELAGKTEWLRQKVVGTELLASDLEEYFAPRQEDPSMQEYELSREENHKFHLKTENKNKESWRKFRIELEANPNQLSDAENLKTWKGGIHRLYDLTRWLQHRVGQGEYSVSREWRLLAEGFNQGVAESYRDGMRNLWRYMQPERPIRKDGNSINTKWTTILAFEGIGIEAGEDPDWISRLSEGEVELATKHGCYSDQSYPDWIDNLTVAYPQIVLPIIESQIAYEWKAAFEGVNTFLYRYRSASLPIPPDVQRLLFKVISGREPSTTNKFNLGLHILQRLELDHSQKRKLMRQGRSRLSQHASQQRLNWALQYLALLLLVDINVAIIDLENWLKAETGTDIGRAEKTFAALFDRHDPIVTSVIDKASVPTLERLLVLVYQYIRPESDAAHESGVYTPKTRDHAESARNMILTALLERPGSDAYRAMQRLLDHPAFSLRRHRFQELARGKVERDTEIPAWTEKEVAAFAGSYTTPAKTGHDLLRVTMAVLSDIQHGLKHGDVTTRPLLERAKDEEEVQNYLVEQMNFRSRDRFRAYREAEIALGDKPDVIVSSTSASCEVAIEVKHGGMDWSPRKLENALRIQLAQKYLKPDSRRQGVFVVTYHGNKGWRDPESNAKMDFATLIEKLKATAAKLVENDSGSIEVACVGIDATEP